MMLALLAAPASHAQDTTFLVTDAGIGRLNADTPYTVKDVSAALGGMPVTESKIYYDDIAVPVLERRATASACCWRSSAGRAAHLACRHLCAEAVTSTGVRSACHGKVFHKLPDRRCRNGLEQQKGCLLSGADLRTSAWSSLRLRDRDDSLPRPTCSPAARSRHHLDLERVVLGVSRSLDRRILRAHDL
jgi:hypothetical protein